MLQLCTYGDISKNARTIHRVVGMITRRHKDSTGNAFACLRTHSIIVCVSRNIRTSTMEREIELFIED